MNGKDVAAAVDTKMMCPQCGETTMLATIEQIPGLALVDGVWSGDGPARVKHSGQSETCWDDSRTVGVRCRGCLWEHQGADWVTRLLPVPPVARVLEVICADVDARAQQGQVDLCPGVGDVGRVHATLLRAPVTGGAPCPRVTLLAELLREPYEHPGGLDRLYDEVVDLLPTVATTLTA